MSSFGVRHGFVDYRSPKIGYLADPTRSGGEKMLKNLQRVMIMKITK